MMTTKLFVPTHSQLRQKRLFKNVLKIDGLSLKFEIENTFYPFSGLNNKLKFQIHPMVKSAANNTSRIPKIYEKEAGDGAYKNYRMLNTCLLLHCQFHTLLPKINFFFLFLMSARVFERMIFHLRGQHADHRGQSVTEFLKTVVIGNRCYDRKLRHLSRIDRTNSFYYYSRVALTENHLITTPES